MLPFLSKNRPQSSLTIIDRKPDEGKEDSPDAGIEAAASDLINAIHSKDVKAVVSALRAVSELIEMPSDESIEPQGIE